MRRYLDGAGSTYLETTFSDFDARGNPETITDPNGRETTFTYDSAGRVKTMTPPYTGGDSTITSTYDVDGNLTRVDFPPDSFSQPYFVRMGYDGKRRMTFLADAQGNAIVYERTGGRVTREALYAGFVDLSNRGTLKGDSTFGFDAAGRMLKAFNPLFPGGTVFTEYGHDAKGNPTGMTDENGKHDNRLYDALDRLEEVAKVRTGTTYTTGFAYDALSNVKQVTDPAGKSTDYLFDDLGRLVKVTSPNTGDTLYVYDLAGNLATKVEDLGGTGRTTQYAYDGLDRLALVDFPTDPSWVFTYDVSSALNQKGRLASATNGVVTTELEYTPRGELAADRTTVGGSSYDVAYVYDAAGKLASLEAPSGVTTSYAYSGSRPQEITLTTGTEQQTIRDIEFLPFGPRTHAEFPPEDSGTGLNTVISSRQHNLRHQVTELDVTSPAGTVLDQSYVYDYTGGAPGPVDPGPNLDRYEDHRDVSQSRFYFYDDLERLWKASDLAGTPIHSYLYDENGNRTQKGTPAGTTSYSYETGADLIAETTGAEAQHYSHDAFGNRIWAGPWVYADSPSHVYDESNRLVEARDPATATVVGQYAYDAFGRRIRRVTGGVTTLFFYGPVGELVESRNPGTTPMMIRSMVYLEDELVGVVDQGATTRFSWVHGDHLGAPLAVTSSPTGASAAVIWRAIYTPFGLATPDEDPDGDAQIFTLDARFPGQLYDAESGLHYSLLRYFDPTTGRFVEAGSVGQANAFNPFVIAGNNPFNGAAARFLQEDIDAMLDVVRTSQPDLDVPETVGVLPLPGAGLGFTNPISPWRGIWIDDRFLETLDCNGLKLLLETLIHESIHRTRPRWDSMHRPVRHPDIYTDAETRRKLLEAVYDLCNLCPYAPDVPQGPLG